MRNSTHDAVAKAQALVNWYEASVRGFLLAQLPDSIEALDGELARLQSVLAQSSDTVVCLVGDSGIGKSTLLNSIVAGDKTVAPAGGVGPLTALATEVRFSEKPRIKVSYHPKKQLLRVAAAMNLHVARQKKSLASDSAAGPMPDIDEKEQKEIESEISEVLQQDNEGSTRTLDEYIRTARLMTTGSQNDGRPVEYLADALSIACSMKPRWGTSLSAEDGLRIKRITDALKVAAAGGALEMDQGADPKPFRELLRDHAAGFLSPLIRRVEVGWPSETLRGGLVLVDLPGVGVAGDVYKQETQTFVRERARAVVLVVGRSGVTTPVMDLLRTTGYWDRLLVSSDDPSSDPCALMIAVSRVDDVANQDWFDIDPDEEGKRPKTKAQVFSEVAASLRTEVRNQFENQLAPFVQTERSNAIREGRERARSTILESLEVYPVSAVEFRRILAQNDDDRPFLASIEQSGVPSMSAHLVRLAEQQSDRKSARLLELVGRFAGALNNHMDAMESTWRSDRAADDAERIRAALRVVLDEKSKILSERRASFRTFLDQTVPEKIKVAVHEAKDEAQKGVSRYLRGLKDAHWSTLRAAVQRGGTYYGARHINLPTDIALRFQDPVAAVWSQDLLKSIRRETYDLASEARKLVVEICDWAATEQGAFVDERVIATQKKAVSARAEQLRDVGKEAIDDLRDVVKTKVLEAIEEPIRSRCKQFVSGNQHIGAGVKNRILELFDELAGDVTEAAARPTEATLLSHYSTVNKDIRSAFKSWGDPLQAVADAIVERHEDRMKRSDSQKRAKVLAEIARIRLAEDEGRRRSSSNTAD